MSLVTACVEKQRRPSRYLVPEGYLGWVKVNYGVENAPKLPIEDGRFLFVFPPSGLIETSSDPEYGWASDDYYYYSDGLRTELLSTGWGYGGLIWGGANGWNDRGDVYSFFFVGAEDEFKRFANENDSDGGPKIGNLSGKKPRL